MKADGFRCVNVKLMLHHVESRNQTEEEVLIAFSMLTFWAFFVSIEVQHFLLEMLVLKNTIRSVAHDQ